MIVPLVRRFAEGARKPLRPRIYWRAFVADCRKFRDGAVMIAQRLRDDADRSKTWLGRCGLDDVFPFMVIPPAPGCGDANVPAASLLIPAPVWL
jgi:hypothetical protein